MMKSKIYVLECLTNLHVGNGDVNFSIIDNEVEKDVVTNFPTINASGVKGALRAYFKENGFSEHFISKLFGSEDNGSAPGQLKFLSANLLAQAVADSEGQDKPYILACPTSAEEQFSSYLENFAPKCNVSFSKVQKDYGIKQVSDTIFQDYDLPVLARNQLNNGISHNLWYEEVVPHKSLFYITVVSMVNEELLDEFDDVVNNKVVQFGANASIGYGLCKLVALN